MATLLWYIVWVVAIIMAALTLAIVIRPSFYRRLTAMVLKGQTLRGIAIARVVIGIIILLAAAFQTVRNFSLMIILGLVIILSGTTIMAIGLPRMKKYIGKMQNRSDWFIRIMGVIGVAFAALLMYGAGFQSPGT